MASVCGIEIDSFLVRGLPFTWFQCGGLNLTWFQCRDRSWLSFRVGVENALVLESWSKLAYYLVKASIWLELGWGSKLTWFHCARLNLTCFQCWGLKDDLISEPGSELTWFSCGGRKTFRFRVWIEMNFFFVSGHRNLVDCSGVEINLCFVWRIEWLGLVWIEISLVFDGGGIEIDLFLVWGSKWTLHYCSGRNWLGFRVGVEMDKFYVGVKIDLVFVWVVEIDLILV